MCGIAGMLDAASAFDTLQAVKMGHHMAAAMRHRGPDGGGVFVDPTHRALLAHRRLAVVDLTPAGAQPMLSRSGRTAIVLNGEIYNFRELRARLAAAIGILHWRSGSDTEVLVEAIEALGLEKVLPMSAGMFAFAVLDRTSGRLTLARDRVGEKPLYFRFTASRILFASDADPIVAASGRPEIDVPALRDLLTYGAVQGPRCIYRGIEQVVPGTSVTFAIVNGQVIREATRKYWSVGDAARSAIAVRMEGDGLTAEKAVEAALGNAVGEQMLADVPIGAFLSGGIDSALVVALMQAHVARKVRTFTIGFSDQDYDESAAAEVVAKRLGTDHTTFMMSETAVQAAMGEVVQAYAEPFADSSQIPTFCVARLARAEVTAVLTGDGGDELFGGYNRHIFAATIWPKIARLPLAARRLAARSDVFSRSPVLAGWLDRAADRLPGAARTRRATEKLGKVSAAIAAPNLAAFHEILMRGRPNAGRFLRASLFDPDAGREEAVRFDHFGLTAAEELMLRDTATYLPSDILVKIDRASMAVSLETRTPFLDHRVFGAAWGVAPAAMISSGKGKQVLRRLLARYMPVNLFERPKNGFAIPLGRWLRTGLADFASHHLDRRRLASTGLIDEAAVTAAWKRHMIGGADHSAELWPVIMFQAWLERQPAANLPGKVVTRQSIAAVRLGAPPAMLELTS